ncbi:mannitol dehydrogenase family protein [Cellulomonas denverensis]|uniref:Mannitol-1-phosphate 5-dehydrogenase n=1 Tax=Cellulomonas denverensis TaxID=264297 RepID=A0A7X6KT53_9CELL|nr:mannitol dehydrogenase family protein [Cellulomonas denverensis]NKY21484.1 mannitol dehydrogenase family protein [Cellulomonas denverensis]GIG26996.1 mannitol 2-dehydrogenase [Cellulomonas denverensis]
MTATDITAHPPRYDRVRLGAGWVHLGPGNFHRAHQAWYLDRLAELGQADGWGVVDVGLRPADAEVRDRLAAQDLLHSVVERHPDGRLTRRTVGAVTGFLVLPEDLAAVRSRLADPATRLVTLTVTEGGYPVDRTTGDFVPSLAEPGGTFDLLVDALADRRAAGLLPFTLLSCDNIPANGVVARRSVLGVAAGRDAGLARWIEQNVAFPSSMVDRITPATTDTERELVRRELGIEDRWPVTCEPFAQWIVEDRFPTGRPALEAVGVEFVADVEPYEAHKLRLLNGTHQAVGHLGMLLGLTTVDEAVAHPRVREFLTGYVAEAAPTLPVTPGLDTLGYGRSAIERFANPQVRDTVRRLVTDASDRVPRFVLGAVADNRRAGRPVPFAAAVLACWAQRSLGADVADPFAEVLRDAARREDQQPGAFLRVREVFGDLGQDEGVVAEFRLAREDLVAGGPERLLARLTSG